MTLPGFCYCSPGAPGVRAGLEAEGLETLRTAGQETGGTTGLEPGATGTGATRLQRILFLIDAGPGNAAA